MMNNTKTMVKVEVEGEMINITKKQFNRLENAKKYVKKGLVLDARYDKNCDCVEVCIDKWEGGSRWTPFTKFEKERQEKYLFNQFVDVKERGRLYKLVTMLKNEFQKLNTTWLTDIEIDTLKKIDKIAQRYGYSLDMMVDVLDKDYSYDDDEFHYFMPKTFDFMKKLWEMKVN